MSRTRLTRPAVLAVALVLGAPAAAHAELGNFELDGKLYTKWLYRNDDSQGVLSLGNPFWPENISGGNGVGGEFELGARARVSRSVSAGVRLKSRFGAVWQNWWENGNLKYAEPNTSGESLGIDHAEYLKLRGYWVRLKPPVPGVRFVHVGSSDLSQFDEWTVGKVRYIDRDNGKGVFFDGGFGEDTLLSWHLAAIALPKLWVGPNWSTGLGDPAVEDGGVAFWTQDWAYAAKLKLEPEGDWGLTAIGSLTNDLEIDRFDPDAKGSPNAGCTDAQGTPIPGCEQDHAVDADPRYRNFVGTVFWEAEPTDTLSLSTLVGWSASRIHERHVANGVADNAGVFPLIYQDTGDSPTDDTAVRIRAEWADPLSVGLSLGLEGFRVGQRWTSMFGARREADVLLTDGLHGGGQLPTLNLANEFIDFDEAWYESIIGWQGLTGLLTWEAGAVTAGLELTGIGYTTDGQGRDVDSIYPDFQHSEGYTDVQLYDYANTLDRGRDLRSVYRRDQDRQTMIAVTRLDWVFARQWTLRAKLKAIRDTDARSEDTREDDYDGSILQAKLAVQAPLAQWLSLTVGGQLDRWREEARSEAPDRSYQDYDTDKQRAFATLKYELDGARFAYHLEYLGKDQQRSADDDQLWRVVRSKATLEVAW